MFVCLSAYQPRLASTFALLWYVALVGEVVLLQRLLYLLVPHAFIGSLTLSRSLQILFYTQPLGVIKFRRR